MGKLLLGSDMHRFETARTTLDTELSWLAITLRMLVQVVTVLVHVVKVFTISRVSMQATSGIVGYCTGALRADTQPPMYDSHFRTIATH